MDLFLLMPRQVILQLASRADHRESRKMDRWCLSLLCPHVYTTGPCSVTIGIWCEQPLPIAGHRWLNSLPGLPCPYWACLGGQMGRQGNQLFVENFWRFLFQFGARLIHFHLVWRGQQAVVFLSSLIGTDVTFVMLVCLHFKFDSG